MKEKLKTKITIALGLLTIIFFISFLSAYQDLVKQKILVAQETGARLGLENKLISLSGLSTDAQQKIKQLEATLDQERANYQETFGRLNQEISGLKEQVSTVTKLKEKLEENLGQALISGN